MKRFILLLTIAVFCSSALKAGQVAIEGLIYSILDSGGVELLGMETSSRNETPVLPEEVAPINLRVPSTIIANGESRKVRGIAPKAFLNESGITTLDLPADLEWIGMNAFSYCSNLNEILTFPTASEIGEGSFSHCGSLEKLDLSRFEGQLGRYCFGDCTGLVEVRMNPTMTSLPPMIFSDCVSLKNIYFSVSLEEIGERAFSGCISLEKLSLPAGLSLIGERAFTGCRSISSIEFGEGNLGIGRGVFENCSSIGSLYLVGITTVGDEAFAGCSGLKWIEIEDEVMSLGRGAFADCDQLMKIYMHAELPPLITPTTFPSTSERNGKLFVPEISIDRYRLTQYWQSFYNVEGVKNYPVGIDNVAETSPEISLMGDFLEVTSRAPNEDIELYTSEGYLLCRKRACISLILPRKSVYYLRIGGSTHKILAY